MTTYNSIEIRIGPKNLAGRLKTICAALLLPLLLTTLPTSVQAQYAYISDESQIRITRYTGPGGDVTIPSTIDGLPVNIIGFAAFSGHFSLTSVTSIEGSAFLGCGNWQ